MKLARSTMVTAAAGAAAALAATGITYASAASASAPQAAPAAAAVAPFGGDSGKGNNNEGKGDEGKGNEGKGNEGREGRNFFHEEGKIHVNDRTYSTKVGGCVTVVSGLGATSLNVDNDSRDTVEVFRGAVCDNGAPVAVVGPHSTSNGVLVPGVPGGPIIPGPGGVVGSFRVIEHKHNDHHDDDRW